MERDEDAYYGQAFIEREDQPQRPIFVYCQYSTLALLLLISAS